MIGKLISYALDALSVIYNLVVSFLVLCRDWFLDLSFFDKLLLFLVIISPLGVILPFARFYIIDFYYSINNPLSITLIFISTALFLSLFLHGPFVLAGRVLLSGYYLVYTLILLLTNSITAAPEYTLYFGFFFNLLFAFMVIIFSIFSYVTNK